MIKGTPTLKKKVEDIDSRLTTLAENSDAAWKMTRTEMKNVQSALEMLINYHNEKQIDLRDKYMHMRLAAMEIALRTNADPKVAIPVARDIYSFVMDVNFNAEDSGTRH